MRHRPGPGSRTYLCALRGTIRAERPGFALGAACADE